MARGTRSRSETNENIRKYLLITKNRNINAKKTKMASEATMAALTEALEAMTNKEPNIKLEACPIKRKNCSLEAWISEVELWDNSNSIGDPAKNNTKKYLALMESIRKAEDPDLERTSEVEFVENQEFDKKMENIIKAMTKKLKEKLGESDVEKWSAVWKEFVNIKQK